MKNWQLVREEALRQAIHDALTQPQWLKQAAHYRIGPGWIAASVRDLITDIMDAVKPFVKTDAELP